MKKIQNKILPLCYSIFVSISILLCLVRFISDSVGGLNGENVRHVSLSECTLLGLEILEGGDLLITDADPQIILPEHSANIRRVLLCMTGSQRFGEMSGFYTIQAGQNFSVRQQVWGQQVAEGEYRFEMPWKHIEQVRIDPGSVAGCVLHIDSIQINSYCPFWNYFIPSWTWILAAVILPGLAACILDWVLTAVQKVVHRDAV